LLLKLATLFCLYFHFLPFQCRTMRVEEGFPRGIDDDNGVLGDA
jgi:hypothetical protein